jgi:Group II intron, maturase-specific domain
MQHARDRVRELTARRRLPLRVEAVVQDINVFLRGWAGYFRYGHSAERLSKIRHYVWQRIALFISKRHRRSRHYGIRALLNFTPNEFGLINLYGIVVSPRPANPGGRSRMPAVNDVGEPYAEEPYARFDRRELETEHILVTATAVGHPDGKPQELEGCRAYHQD